MKENIPIYKFALREDLEGNNTFLPVKSEPKATGWDVRAAMHNKLPLVIEPFQHVRIPLGFRGFCPEGWWYGLKPRSSTFAKKNLHALYGVVDESYEGELIFACQYIPEFEIKTTLVEVPIDPPIEWMDSKSTFVSKTIIDGKQLKIEFGEAIGQIIPIKRQDMTVEHITNEEYDSLCKARNFERGTGGFGSTGK